MTSPKQQYNALVKAGNLQFDTHQQTALHAIERIHRQLTKQPWRHWFHIPVKGLYCFGPVGVGKTVLMDLLAQTTPVKKKRMHFYLFMQFVHEQLTLHQGQKDPLKKIAKQLSHNCQLLLFDEFYVKNIADAMILGELLKALFHYHVCFVATSNTKPDKLYWEGLQRENFLPAIEEIKKHCQVLDLKSQHDYRLSGLMQHGVYFYPENPEKLNALFTHLSHTHHISCEPLMINERPICIVKRTTDVLWIDFKNLCHPPRSSRDYAVLVKKFSPIIIDRIPAIQSHENNVISNFIQFIDVAYDNHTHCIFSAQAPIDKIYTKGKYAQDFNRTRSRIIEMQSEAYIKH